MAEWIKLPQLGANITEGTVGRWRKAEGDAVGIGEPLVEVITSKATFDVESTSRGLLLKILAPQNSHVPIGYVMAVVGQHGETAPDAAAENEKIVAAFRAQAASESIRAQPAQVKATPGARRAAREANIDLARIPMPSGRDILREEDVRAFIEASKT